MSTVMPLAKLVALNKGNGNGQTTQSSGTSIFSDSGRSTPNTRNKRMSILRTTKPQTSNDEPQLLSPVVKTTSAFTSTKSLLAAEQNAQDQLEMERFLQELQSEELIEKRFGWNRRQKLLLSSSLDDTPSPTTTTMNNNGKSPNQGSLAPDQSQAPSRRTSINPNNASTKSSFSRSFRAMRNTTKETKNAADFIPAFDDEYNPHSIFDHYSGFIYRDPAIPVAWKDAFLDADDDLKKNTNFSYAKRALRAGHMINCYRPWGKEKPQDDLTMLVKKTLASASIHDTDDEQQNEDINSMMSGSSFLFEKPSSANPNRRGLLQHALMGVNTSPGDNHSSLPSPCDNSVTHGGNNGHPHAQFIQEHSASLDASHHHGRHKLPVTHRPHHHHKQDTSDHETGEPQPQQQQHKEKRRRKKKHVRQHLVINVINQSMPGSVTL